MAATRLSFVMPIRHDHRKTGDGCGLPRCGGIDSQTLFQRRRRLADLTWRRFRAVGCEDRARLFYGSPASAARALPKKLTTGLRAFLRYPQCPRSVPGRSHQAVPTFASWRLARLPRYLTTEQVDSLVAACDGSSPARRRDRAIILLLARLGLRAGDVAGLLVFMTSNGKLARCGSLGRGAIRFDYPSHRRSETRS